LISSIEGTIRSKEGNRIIVEIGGVGFEVYVPLRTLDVIGGEGEKVHLRTYLHVKEDALTLFGFLDDNEKRLFQALLGVSGVGPKVALAILSVSEAGDLARLIHEEKTKALMSFPGIGRKTAERIVLELKDRIDIERYTPGVEFTPPGIDRGLIEESIAALATLGFTRANAKKALENIELAELGEPCRVEDIVREVLKRTSAKA
jgi:Holliday junction DNA helicase RuvA